VAVGMALHAARGASFGSARDDGVIGSARGARISVLFL
jgi:hypothetical protein